LIINHKNMNIEGALAARPREMSRSSQEEMAAIRKQMEAEVEASFSGNPDEKYSTGSLQDSDESYIEQVTREVDRRMADPAAVRKVKEYLDIVNDPKKRWN